MKIGIQPTPIGFTNRWIKYCQGHNIEYKLINCYGNDVIEQLSDCDALMWHHDLLLTKDNLVAKRLLFALEHSGKIVFPNFYSGWHYDDKVAQKYLLEALNAPIVPTYVYHDKKDALKWANNTTFPKVFKLKGGAGSSNVKLVKSKLEAIKLINKAFSKGMSPIQKSYFLKEKYRKYKLKKINLLQLLKGLFRYFLPINKGFITKKETDYAYFQEFIPNNDGDYRINVINQNKACGVKRYNRENDFRASGSGKQLLLDNTNCRLDLLKIAFETAKKLKMDSIGFDFVIDKNDKPKIVEISYAFGWDEVDDSGKGYWDEDLNWCKGEVKAHEWMIENVIKKIKLKKGM
tara:strand:+ start:124 stop:1164 length:1041 start_codon:yes stop_codon:yes gene_type:complete